MIWALAGKGVEMFYKYQNERISKVIKQRRLMADLSIFSLLIALFCLGSSIFNTFHDVYTNEQLVTGEHYYGVAGTTYCFDIDTMPEEVSNRYYMVRFGDDEAILMKNVSGIINDFQENGKVTVRGVLHGFKKDDPVIDAAKQYYDDYNIYSGEKREKMATRYVDCSKIYFSDVLLHDHPLGLSFGITFLIVLGIFESMDKSRYIIKDLFPSCGTIKYTPEQIDEQAQLPETEWIPDCECLASPSMMIGIKCGITAVDYMDIAKVYIKKKWHTESQGKHRPSKEYHTYALMVVTKNHKLLKLYEDRSIGYASVLKKFFNEKCGNDVWVDKKTDE